MRVKQAVIFALVASLVLFGADRSGMVSFPRQLAGGIISPIQLGWYRFSQAVSERLAIVGRIGSLSQDNLTLSEENDRLKAEIAKLETVKKDNESLLAQIGTSETKGYNLLMTETLGFTPTLGERELILSAGAGSGVKVDQAVISGNVVLGRISSVQADRSTLRLLTDPQSKVLVITSKGARGILTGQFQSSAKLSKVLLDEPLNIGDIVLTTGEGDWPPRLVAGEVTKVTKRDNDLFQEAEVRPLVSYEKLHIVAIVLGNK